MHPDLFKRIESFEDPEPYINDIFKLDFIHLKEVLFKKKRDIDSAELDRLLMRTDFSDEDKEKIKKFIPRSNWEKYFSTLIDDRESSLEKKWDILYKLRNKVAHNRHVRKDEFEQIKGLTSEIRDIIGKASAKLGEIDLNEEDRDLIIYSYTPAASAASGYLAEKAVAEYYARSGYEIEPIADWRGPTDFLATKEGTRIAVDVKYTRPQNAMMVAKMMIARHREMIGQFEANKINKIQIAVVLKEPSDTYPMNRLLAYALRATEESGFRIEIQYGKLNEDNLYVPLNERDASIRD